MDCASSGYRPGGPARAIQCGLHLLPTGRYRRSVRFARTFPAEPWIREGKLVETRSRFGGSSTASPLSAATPPAPLLAPPPLAVQRRIYLERRRKMDVDRSRSAPERRLRRCRAPPERPRSALEAKPPQSST